MTPEQYRYLIAELLTTVVGAGGRMRRHDAELGTASRLGISVTNMQGVAVHAHTDRVLIYDLRSDSLTVPESTDPSDDGQDGLENWAQDVGYQDHPIGGTG